MVATFLIAMIRVSEWKCTTVGILMVCGALKAGTHGYLFVLHFVTLPNQFELIF